MNNSNHQSHNRSNPQRHQVNERRLSLSHTQYINQWPTPASNHSNRLNIHVEYGDPPYIPLVRHDNMSDIINQGRSSTNQHMQTDQQDHYHNPQMNHLPASYQPMMHANQFVLCVDSVHSSQSSINQSDDPFTSSAHTRIYSALSEPFFSPVMRGRAAPMNAMESIVLSPPQSINQHPSQYMRQQLDEPSMSVIGQPINQPIN